MRWREAIEPVRMERVALVAPVAGLRAMLTRVADSGTVEPDLTTGPAEPQTGPAARRLQRLRPDAAVTAALCPDQVDLDELERDGRADLLAGEAALEQYAATAVVRGAVAALPGWVVAADVPALAQRLAESGAAVVPLPRPRGVDPPTLLSGRGGVRRSAAPLVETYAVVPYADVDPTVLAALAYVVMFGMMFGDVGHGLLLIAAGLALRAGRPRRLAGRLAKVRKAWPFVAGAGLASAAFGALYGEFFGPTGLVQPLWLAPLEQPIDLLVAAIGVGAVLLAGAYAIGAVNRWREGGWPLALYAPSGLAGIALFVGLAVVALAVRLGPSWLVWLGAAIWLTGLALVFSGLLVASGGGPAGVTQAVVELFDTVIRVGSNLLSFARLAAFGMTHAALGALVWQGTTALAGSGPPGWIGAVVLFAGGNLAAFTLEAVVAAVQALRLEYYELFSRVFQSEGRPFRPWHIPLAPALDRQEDAR
jgi:V/A-type H+-transporting ATPase subunit I